MLEKAFWVISFERQYISVSSKKLKDWVYITNLSPQNSLVLHYSKLIMYLYSPAI